MSPQQPLSQGPASEAPAPAGRASSYERELIERIRWFIALRWGAVVGMATVTAAARYALHIDVPARPLYLIAGTIAGYNLVVLGVERWAEGIAPELRHPVASGLANFQMSADLVALASAIHFAGGVENPFAFFFVFHIIIASMLLSPRATALQVSLAVVLFADVALGECYGVLPHYHLAGVAPDDLYTRMTFVWGLVAAFAGTLAGAAYLTTSITGRLRRREDEVLALSGQLARNAADLQAAYDKLSEAERAKSAYMRRVSHELRAPLGAVQSGLRVILEGITGELPCKAKEMVALWTVDSPNADQIKTLAHEIDGLRSEMRDAGIDYMVKGLSVLNATQRAKLREIMKKCAARCGGMCCGFCPCPGMGCGMGMGPGPGAGMGGGMGRGMGNGTGPRARMGTCPMTK